MTIYNSETGKALSDVEIAISHDDLIDELYPEVQIGIYTWFASAVLYRMDPVAYKVSLIEHVDQMVDNGTWFEVG